MEIILILRTVMYSPVEAHSRLSQTSKMDLSARLVCGLKLMLLTIFFDV